MTEIKEVSKTEYIDLQKRFNLHPLQSFAWGELKRPGWQPVRLCLLQDDKPVWAITILKKKMPFIGGNLGYIPRGFGTDKMNSLGDLLETVKQYGKTLGLAFLIVDPDISLGKGSANLNIVKDLNEKFLNVGFKQKGTQIQPSRTVVLDLRKSEDELISAMRPKHRQYIRKAEKNGIRIKEGKGDDIDTIGEIIEQIGRENKYVFHNRDYYRKAYELFSSEKNAAILLALSGEKIVGGYLLIFNEKNVFEMYGGCTREGNSLLASYLLKWESIKYSKKLGKQFYDQWGAEFRYPGLVQFKEGFGGIVLEFPSEYVYVYNKGAFFSYRIVDYLNKFRQKAA